MRADIHDGREQTFPSKGRIQMRKTNNLLIIKSGLHRTAGPYRWVTSDQFVMPAQCPLLPRKRPNCCAALSGGTGKEWKSRRLSQARQLG